LGSFLSRRKENLIQIKGFLANCDAILNFAMQKARMCRIRFLIFVAALAALTSTTWSNCQAIGSFQTKPAFPKVMTAGIAPPQPTIALPDVSGRDSQTHACRGPADIR
jgi:hypothetical protein